MYIMCSSRGPIYRHQASSTSNTLVALVAQCRQTTGWRRLIGSPKLQIIFHKRATTYRALLRNMTYKDKGSYESSPPCRTTCRQMPIDADRCIADTLLSTIDCSRCRNTSQVTHTWTTLCVVESQLISFQVPKHESGRTHMDQDQKNLLSRPMYWHQHCLPSADTLVLTIDSSSHESMCVRPDSCFGSAITHHSRPNEACHTYQQVTSLA